MMEFDITRDLPPPIGQLSEEEHQHLIDALPLLATGDDGPLLRALQDVLEDRVSEQEFGDYQLFPDEDQREILQRVAEQVPDLAGIHLKTDGE